MRDDFKKVLCEEPRYRGWNNKGKALNKRKGCKKEAQKAMKGDYEEWSLPSKESMRSRGGWSSRGDKDFGEHLGPLVRFLRSSVGCKWDVVYSEIAKKCPNDSAVNAHIYQHLWDYVERYAVFRDGKVYHDFSYGWRKGLVELTDRGKDNTFYVDANGVLRRAPKFIRKSPEKEKIVHHHKGKIYIKVEGIWYEGKFRPIPNPMKRLVKSEYGRVFSYTVWDYPTFHDIFVKRPKRDYYGRTLVSDCKRMYGKEVYCYKKTQLGSKALKRLGLKNNNKEK